MGGSYYENDPTLYILDNRKKQKHHIPKIKGYILESAGVYTLDEFLQ